MSVKEHLIKPKMSGGPELTASIELQAAVSNCLQEILLKT